MSEQATATAQTGPDDAKRELPFMVATYVLPVLGVVATIGTSLVTGVEVWHVVLFLAFYFPTLAGITIGYHRLCAHQSFRPRPWIKGLLAILGSMAGQGPVIKWAEVHLRHHADADGPNDPHSPLVRGGTRLGVARGLWNGSFGWLFHPGSWLGVSWWSFPQHLVRDPIVFRIHVTYFLWLALGLALPAAIGAWVAGSWLGALQGFLWGGLTRMFATHVCIAAVNSIGHRYGASPLNTGDESRNLAWLAIPSLGDGWHNNHHALPGVASLRFKWWQLDPGGTLIWLLEKCGLATDVRWPTRRMLEAKLPRASAGS